MGKKTKAGKSRRDKFYFLAKEQGYRSRAAFKLLQLNKKYDFLKNAKCLIDLCAAPGGWMQVARKFMPASSLIVGIDLDPIRAIPGTISMVEDITTAKCRKALKSSLNDWKADVVIHDGSPNVGGNWAKDAYGQSELVLHAAKLACEFLAENGMFISKVFRSKDYNNLLWVLKQLFQKVEVTKPEASRSTSAEIYFICKGYLNPSKIDPEMFKPECIFKDVEGVNKVNPEMTVNSLHKEMLQQKRQRSGYEDDRMLLYKKLSVKAFLDDPNPIPRLAEFNVLEFDEASKQFLDHPLTSNDVKESCQDLKVLGKREFSVLLKWHKGINKERKAESQPEVVIEEQIVEPIDEEAELDAKIAANIEEMKNKEKKRLRRLKKKRKDQKMKASQMSLTSSEVAADINEEASDSLFSLNQIKSEVDLDRVHEGDIAEEEDDSMDSADENSEEEMEQVDRVDRLEDEMQSLYDEYKHRKQIIDKKRKAEIRSLGLESEDDEPEINEVIDESADEAEILDDANPLKRSLVPENQKQVNRDMFFERDLFKELEGMKDIDAKHPMPKQTVAPNPNPPVVYESSDEEERKTKVSKSDTFEVVPMEEISTWTDDSDAEAEVMALGSAMLRKKKKLQMIDDSYNRYAFHDATDELPEWFVEDEAEHLRPQIPVTKAEVDVFKAKLMEINARPIKKIMEARSRKKLKAIKKFENMKQKAQSIIDSDMPEKEKLKRMQTVYAKKQTKKDKVYVVSKKGGGTFGNSNTKGKRVIRVDTRMKADKKGLERAEKRKSKRRRK